MSKTLIAPSILAADFGNLQRDVEMINQSDAHWFHLDVMDGVFVPNISFGMPVISAIKKHAKTEGSFKDGGRVRGVGKATHGHGKAMKKQGKK